MLTNIRARLALISAEPGARSAGDAVGGESATTPEDSEGFALAMAVPIALMERATTQKEDP